jgi:pantoate--beta-alanine ligase
MTPHLLKYKNTARPINNMKVAESIPEMKSLRKQVTGTVGFVPTMGYLHEGHMSLVKHARAENDCVVVSIYVNPTQFGPSEDFEKYPRDAERDLAMLKKENTDIVFMPTNKEMYPEGYQSWVTVEKLTDPLEGAIRPGHFKGVTTIVAKLFNIVQPTKTYFGQKDAQQALVIKKMAKDLNMNLDVIVSPTIREPDGLAMSSRNVYLNPQERKAATVLFKSLSTAKSMWENGEKNAERLRKEMTSIIQKEPLAEIQYISVADAETLVEIEEVNRPAVVSMAVKFGRTRLIDNFIFMK